jgi:DNA-binding HxlR family transcriptional regulator
LFLASFRETMNLLKASMRRRHRKSDCPIHFALEIFGDPWTLLIIRDLMFKARTSYTDLLRAEEGIATNVLADRLVRLEEDGIIEKEAGSGRGTGSRYWLTSKGIDLLPILLKIIDWSAKYDPKTAADPKFVRRLRAAPMRLESQIRKKLQKEAVHLKQAAPRRQSSRLSDS